MKSSSQVANSQAVFTLHWVSLGWQQTEKPQKPSLHTKFPLIPRVSFYHLLSSQPSLGAPLCCSHSLRLQSTSRRAPPANKHQTSAMQTHTTHCSSKHPPQGISPLAAALYGREPMAGSVLRERCGKKVRIVPLMLLFSRTGGGLHLYPHQLRHH